MSRQIETISLTEAIKRYSSVLSLEQIIALREFNREFLNATVSVEQGQSNKGEKDSVNIKITVP